MAGGRAGFLASSFPVLHASILRGTLARSRVLLVPTFVRFGSLRAWAMCGARWDGKQEFRPIMSAVAGGRFETLGGNGRRTQEFAHFYSRCASAPGPLSRRPSRRPSLYYSTVVPRRSTQHKVHASTLVPIAPLGQRLPLLVRWCQI